MSGYCVLGTALIAVAIVGGLIAGYGVIHFDEPTPDQRYGCTIQQQDVATGECQ